MGREAGAYVPAHSTGASAGKAASPAVAVPTPLEEPTTQRISRRRKHHGEIEPATPTAIHSPASSSAGDGKVVDLDLPDSLAASGKKHNRTESGRADSTRTESTPDASKAVGADSVPSTEELLTVEAPASSSEGGASTSRTESSKSRRISKRTTVAAPVTEQVTAVPSRRSSSKRSRQNPEVVGATREATPITTADSASVDAQQDGVTTMTPSELAALTKKMKAREQVDSGASETASNSKASDRWAKSEAAPEVETPSKPISTMTPSEREAYEASNRRKRGHTSGDATVVASAKGGRPADAYDPALDGNQKGAVDLDSDQWHPKAGAPAAADEVDIVPPPTQVAMVPKPAPAPDASVESLLKIAAQNQGAVPNEGEKWVPKDVKPVQADADVAEEINRIRAQRPAPPPPVKVRRDINNPEEGVLPVNSFEKFAGPRYGRHREYERRFYLGKRAKAKAENYDFYVDEVDRKKEIHNIYYYQKGKAPKLIAVERHTHVTFMSNYDVDKEDKGKVTKY